MSLHQFSADMSISLLTQFASRGLWYLAVLALAGLLLWVNLFKLGESGRSSVTRVSINLQRLHIFAILFMILTHLEEMLDGGGFDELPGVFLSTSVGIGWLVLLLLSIIGLTLLTRVPRLSWVWAIAFLLVSSMYGHSPTGDPRWVTMILGFVHLVASALLIGGLLFALVIRSIQSELLLSFLRKFTLSAVISIVVLSITGTLSTVLLLPSLSYLYSTQWGIMLGAKVLLTLLVTVLIAIIWFKTRNKQVDSVTRSIKVNFSLTIAIVLIVGCITYMSPTPTNKPLFWHEMGETIHMSARINPMFVGPNTFRTKIWLPKEDQAPKLVQMQLYSLDRSDLTPINILLTPYKDSQKEADFEGFTEYSYKAEDKKLPFSGNWRLEIHVQKVAGEETVYKKEFKLN